jgi:hypothetical protein
MAANATTKIQVNYGKDGLLVNIYADNAKELEELLTTVQDSASLLESVGSSIGRSNTQPAGSNAVAYAKAALGATVVAAPTGDAPDCKHGTMSFRSGVGQKGPWKGWMCAAPKGAVDKCDTVWVR